MALDADRRYEITARVSAFAERLQAMRIVYGADDQVDLAIRCAATARHMDGFLAATADGATRTHRGANIRDAAMAENVEWILGREDKIVIGAANGHLQRVPLRMPPIVNDPLTTLGQHLAATLGRDLVVIGSAFGGGTLALHRPLLDGPAGHTELFTEQVGPFEPDTLDAVLAAAGPPLHLTDLRGVAAIDATKTMSGGQPQPIDPLAAYDAVVYIDSVTPWHAFPTA